MTIMDMFQGMLLMLFFSYHWSPLRSVEPERRHLRAWFMLFAEYDGYPHEDVAGFAPYRGFSVRWCSLAWFLRLLGSAADGVDCGAGSFG